VWVRSEDARLYVLVRGDQRTAPILVWLHGGPGGAERPLFRLFNGSLEHHFLVAYWDQRGAGRSFDPDADPARLTIQRHVSDLDRVVDYLRQAFQQENVTLVGHSWGSALGLLYVRDHPEKVAAFVGVAPVVSTAADARAQLEFVESEALERNETSDLRPLREQLGPPPFAWRQDLALQRWVDRYGGVFHRPPSRWGTVFQAVVLGYVKPWEIYRMIRANELSLEAMNDEIGALDLRSAVPRVTVPVLFVLGRYDRVTDPSLARAYLAQLVAPRKCLVWAERSAHNVPFEEPDRFDATVIEFLQPATADRRKQPTVAKSSRHALRTNSTRSLATPVKRRAS